MLASLRALREHLFEFQKTGRGLMLALVTPLLATLLVGQLSVRPQSLRLLIAGSASGDAAQSLDRLEALLRELPGLSVSRESKRPEDPLQTARRGQYDLVIVSDELGSGEIAAYSMDTEPARLAQLTQLAAGIEQTLATLKDPKKATGVRELSAVGIIPPQSLHLYYPRARDRSAGFLPMTIALVLCFFPFIIAAPSLVQERESHTIDVLLTAPGMTHNWLFAAKCYLPILVAAFDAVLMFVCAESFYQYYFKSGALLFGVYVLLAIGSATFLGLAISAVVRSTIQAAAASALYFVCLLLFGGFFVDLDQSAVAVRLVANCLPLAVLDPIVKTWMFGGQLPGVSALPLHLLLGQTMVSGAIAWISYRRVFLRRI